MGNDSVTQLVIDDLALSEAVLRERIVSLEKDVSIYRELTCAAFDALRRLTIRHHQLRESSRRVHDEYQALRQERLLEAGADDDESVAA
jgi:hypothetical protein